MNIACRCNVGIAERKRLMKNTSDTKILIDVCLTCFTTLKTLFNHAEAVVGKKLVIQADESFTVLDPKPAVVLGDGGNGTLVDLNEVQAE